MRVLHVIPSIAAASSGTTQYVTQLHGALRTLGVSSTVLAIGEASHLADSEEIRLVRPSFGPRRLGVSRDMKREIVSTLKAGEFDVVHSHGLWMMPGIYAVTSARKSHVPCVVSPHGTLSTWSMNSGSRAKSLFWRVVQRRGVEGASCIHATSREEVQEIRSVGMENPIAIIPNGVTIPERAAPHDSSERTLLFLGRLHPKKGLDLLLRAWALVEPREPRWKLRIVGPNDHGYAREMKSLSDSLNLRRVQFVGERLAKERDEEYRAASLFVLPSHSENFGQSIAEAMAFGVPVIVSKGTPWSRVNDENAGWWIENRVEEMVKCLSSAMVLTNSELRMMGLNGRRWMEQEFSWVNTGSQLLEVYRWLAQRASGVPASVARATQYAGQDGIGE